MPVYHIQPHDLLFFRDARPMEPQSPGGGRGARWPHPAVFFDAIHAALWRAFPKPSDRGFADHSFFFKKDGKRIPVSNQRSWFQSLTTAGPFPILENQWLFPPPGDALPDGGQSLPITEHHGTSNRPEPLQYCLGATTRFTKEVGSRWWSKDAFEAYLADGTAPTPEQTFKSEHLFDTEWTTGIGINPLTETQDGERIYSAQYLRLREKTKLGLWASLPEANGFDGMERLFRPDNDLQIILAGGQQRACRVHPQPGTDLTSVLPVSSPLPADCTRLKWVLLTPSVFPAVSKEQTHPGGWLPTWIHPQDGRVLLNNIQKNQSPGRQQRKDRRQPIVNLALNQCRLVAACIPKPFALTGWTEACHIPELDGNGQPYGRKPRGPRETMLAVPAGSVYYFECPEGAAQTLSELLSWHGSMTQGVHRIIHRRSSLLGEKGFGLGVCTGWKPFSG